MKLRNVLGLAVTVPALVVTLAQPSVAVQGVVTFGGTMQIRPTASGLPQTAEACFSAVASCPNDIQSTGAASGLATGQVIDGLYVKASYPSPCVSGPVNPIATGSIEFWVHDALSGEWHALVPAALIRAGEVLVFTGAANGEAHVTPLGVPVCDAPLTVAIDGSAVLTY